MKVLVTAATKHGATEEMASWIGDVLRGAGLDVVLRKPDEVSTLAGVDAIILGSGVYAGRWLGEATRLVDRLGAEFLARPVWLFSSGPVGDSPKPEAEPVDAARMLMATGAREHRLFAGRIDRASMGFAERAVVTALRVPDRDDRSRPEIAAWAYKIAAALVIPSASMTPVGPPAMATGTKTV